MGTERREEDDHKEDSSTHIQYKISSDRILFRWWPSADVLALFRWSYNQVALGSARRCSPMDSYHRRCPLCERLLVVDADSPGHLNSLTSIHIPINVHLVMINPVPIHTPKPNKDMTLKLPIHIDNPISLWSCRTGT